MMAIDFLLHNGGEYCRRGGWCVGCLLLLRCFGKSEEFGLRPHNFPESSEGARKWDFFGGELPTF